MEAGTYLWIVERVIMTHYFSPKYPLYLYRFWSSYMYVR